MPGRVYRSLSQGAEPVNDQAFSLAIQEATR